MDLSVCIPGIRVRNWRGFFDSIVKSVGNYSFELIIVGPFFPDLDLYNEPNFKYFRDFGSPCRSAQIAMSLAEGEFVTWGSDDGLFTDNSLSNCLDLLSKLDLEKDGIIIQYSEGRDMSGTQPDPSYWLAHTHEDQRVAGVPNNFNIAPVAMYHRKLFEQIGGWDCRFENLNISCHDLAYRVQKNGGKFSLSPDLVLCCDWSPGYLAEIEHVPVHDAHFENDIPLFNELYREPNDRMKIDFNNWKLSPQVWTRRFRERL